MIKSMYKVVLKDKSSLLKNLAYLFTPSLINFFKASGNPSSSCKTKFSTVSEHLDIIISILSLLPLDTMQF